jgi:hypothetical protein
MEEFKEKRCTRRKEDQVSAVSVLRTYCNIELKVTRSPRVPISEATRYTAFG